MSFDMQLYTRHRPIIDETQSGSLERGDVYTWEEERWEFEGSDISVGPFRYDPKLEDILSTDFEYTDDPPLWVKEVRWQVIASGLPTHGDDFDNWFSKLARSFGGVIRNPYMDRNKRYKEPAYEPSGAAHLMVLATRPIHCDHDDRTTDMIRQSEEAVRLGEEYRAMEAKRGTPSFDLRKWETIVENLRQVQIPADAGCDTTYGASLSVAVDVGVHLSWGATQYLYLAALPYADAQELVEFSLFSKAVRGPRDPFQFARLTRHLDARIEALLRDPSRASELRALVGDGPLDPILRDAAGLSAAPIALADSIEIRNELIAFGERIVELDPRLDPKELEELRRPRMT